MSSYPFNVTKNVPTPSANTDTTVTLAAVGSKRHKFTKLWFGYDGTPTAGMLTITEGGTTTAQIPITTAGAGPLSIEDYPCAVGEEVVVTLAAGGSGVKGYLTVHSITE